MNVGMILNRYRAMDMWNRRWFDPYIGHRIIPILAASKTLWRIVRALPYMETWECEVRKPQWPILWNTTANSFARELLIQTLCRVSTEAQGAP